MNYDIDSELANDNSDGEKVICELYKQQLCILFRAYMNSAFNYRLHVKQ